MNIEKLIERLKAKDFERDYDCTPFECGVFGLLDTAATALSTLQAENEKLRAELENYRKGHCSEGGCAAEKDRDLIIAENEKLRAELEQVKNERDSAKATLQWLKLHSQKED